VLILRAGIGIGHPRSRRQVARLTHMRPVRVAKLERRGLKELRALNRTGGCAPASGRAPLVAGAAGAGGAPSSGAPAGTPDLAHVLAEHRSGGLQSNTKPRLSVQSSSLAPPLSTQPSGGGGVLGDLRDPLLIAAAILLAVALMAELRRERAGR
jgi:hypothetical protein